MPEQQHLRAGGRLEVLRAAPSLNGQNTNPRLNSRLLTAGLDNRITRDEY